MKSEQIITKIAEAPAKALDEAIHSSEKVLHELGDGPTKKVSSYWRALGPGLTTGASDDDPAGVATYSQAGAKYGFQLLWMAPVTFVFMALVQEMCARIGLVTGKGLAANIRALYSKKVLYVLTLMLVGANIFNIGADLGAMAKGLQLIFPSVPFVPSLIVFTVVSLGLQIFVDYSNYAKYLKYLSFVLLLYIASAFAIGDLPWREIWHNTVTPTITWTKDSWLLICAILGTTISPYLFFWQTSSEVEEQQLKAKLQHMKEFVLRKKTINKMRFDVWSGMFLSNLVMFFIIVTCGAVLFPNGILVESAEAAALALRPLVGDQAYTLFALGIIGTGMLAVPVLAGSAAYAIAETLKWHGGLKSKLNRAHAFYGVIIIAMLAGMAINFTGLNPIKALIYSAVFNGLVAPFILYFIVKISSNREVMGKWHNKSFTTMLGWVVVVLMSVSGIGAVWSMFG